MNTKQDSVLATDTMIVVILTLMIDPQDTTLLSAIPLIGFILFKWFQHFPLQNVE